MLKTHKKTLLISSALTLLPILIGLYYWDQLPDVMATHFGADNGADGFSSKAFTVFALPLFLLAVHWLAAFFTAHDPRKQNISPRLFTLILWFVPVISLVMNGVTYFYNLGYAVDITFVCQLLVGVMLIVVGNYLPKARQNYTVGIKIPWTLANEENWNRTHRLAGVLWLAGGVLTVVLTLCRVSPVWVFAVVAAIAVIPCGYSFWLHAKKSL